MARKNSILKRILLYLFFNFSDASTKKLKGGIQHRYLQFTHFEPREGDIVVKQSKNTKELRHDHFLRKFEYTKALDQVLKPYVQRKFPEYTFSVHSLEYPL